MKNLKQEKILENEIEKTSLELEVEALKEEVTLKEKMLNERIQVLLERRFTLEEIKELTK